MPFQDNFRRILHIDLDAFFASVEQRDHPALRGKPVAVGLNVARGVVASASYEARKFGVHSAQPSSQAAKLCPNLIFVPGRMDVYKSESKKVSNILSRFTDLIEPVSIDEAFLDVTANPQNYRYALDIAKEIKKTIKTETGLVASAGVSYNKFLAKIASDWRKPDGLCVIHPNRALAFIDKLPVKAIWGVGPVTAQKMQSLGITTGKDLREKELGFLVDQFGKSGYSFYNFARGIDDREVTTTRIRKQVSAEVTFSKDESDPKKIESLIHMLAGRLQARLLRHNFRGTSLTLKIRFKDFQTITRSFSRSEIIFDAHNIAQIATELFSHVELKDKSIRLIGLAIGNRYLEESDTEPLLPFGEFMNNEPIL